MNDITLKEYVESRLCALDKRVDTAVQNIEKSTSAAFAASQKAIDKQELSQTTYNAGHNDLSRKMEEQYKLMIPRAEHEVMFQRINEDIKSLRETRSQVEGKGIGNRELISWVVAILSITGMVVALIR